MGILGMSKPTKSGDAAERESGIRAVDRVLPERVDRRRFLETAVTGTMLAIAGCSGTGGGGQDTTTTTTASDDGDTTTESSGPIGSDVGFRLPVEPGPNYVTAFAAQQQGFWEEAGITPLTPEGGNGSGDTSKRIATGVNTVGHSAVTPQVAGLARGEFNLLQFGTAKARTQAGLIYRTDQIEDAFDPSSLRGAKIAAADGLDEQMWQLFLDGIGASDIELEYIDTSAAATLLQRNEIHAIWDSINDFAELQAQLDAELSFAPMYNVEPLGGYYMIVNEGWYNDNDNDHATEWVTRLMEGYSAAGHWALTNREAAMEMLMEQVPELQTLGTEELLRPLAAGVAATNLTSGVKENGFGYLDREVQETTFGTISRILDLETPDAEQRRLTEVTDQVELTQFSDDEWADLQEFAEPYASFFEEP
jgi:ABC-type nitrate/sulfonate/bicarbonate transport system substrate-binding protein